MIVSRRCHSAGIIEDLSWGACPECSGRRFASDVEQWRRRVAHVAVRGPVV